MTLKIAARLKPFSHTPGASCLIPGTKEIIEAYPTLLRIASHEFHPLIHGPVRNFTLEQDLERNCVWVFGQAKEGFYRLKIEASLRGFEIFADSVPEGGLPHSKGVLLAKEKIFIAEPIPFFLPEHWERLSLGSHRAQDWDLVWRRFDLREILPVLFGLGQKIPPLPETPLQGVGLLLKEGDLEPFCRAAFSKILVPRWRDTQHQGLMEEAPVTGDPSQLLHQAQAKIRALFFQQRERHLHLLPTSFFEAGRLLHLQAPEIGELDFEWRKKLPHRVIFRVKKSCEVFLDLPSIVKSYRIKTALHEKGTQQKSNELLSLEAGTHYYLDNFETK